jgi:hypothetical protein
VCRVTGCARQGDDATSAAALSLPRAAGALSGRSDNPAASLRFHREPNKLKRHEIAGHTLHRLKEHYAGKLRVPDIKMMFEKLRDEMDG